MTTTKLEILAYKKINLDTKEYLTKFTAPINPASISLSFATQYNKTESQGTDNPEMKYAGGDAPKLSLELIIDGTRFSDALVDKDGNKATVLDKVEEFKSACYYYIPDKHETPYVKITWGNPLLKHKKSDFAGRVESFSVNFTLFSSDGTPLRAKISASFIASVAPAVDKKQQASNSPDLTHLITIKAGDSLPTLCDSIYGDPQMCHQVAKINKLVNFRSIEPGQELEFPPMK